MSNFIDYKTKSHSYERLSCRVNAKIKQQAEAAAEMLGQSITSFTEMALLQAAQKAFLEHDQILLSERDYARFIEAINNPPAPTPQLIDAVEKYKQLSAENPEGNF